MRLIMAQSKEEKAAYQRAYREANKEKVAATQRTYYKANKEKVLASHRAWREANKEKVAARKRAYREANKENVVARERAWQDANKERRSATNKAWYAANSDKVYANTSRRRARKLKLIPKHLKKCPVEKQRVLDIFKLCRLISKATGIEHHVDHMWPVSDSGPEWSGNMQIITARENKSKGASVDLELKHNIQQSLKETM